MPSLTLSIVYGKNTGLVFNSTELKNLYFTGIDLKDQFGNPIPEETINFFIEAAQKEVQDLLTIKLNRTCYTETRDFVNDDYMSWGYVPTTYPVVEPVSLQGFMNTTLQINYPAQWLTAKRQVPDEDLYHRSMNLVPINGPSASYGAGTFVGILPLLGYFGNKQIPNYWAVKYLTGFNKVPTDILNYIGRLTATSILTNLQDIYLGVGVASKSIGIDGLSQSLSTTASAMYGLFSARFNQYKNDMERQLPLLKARYCGIAFGVM